MSTVAEPIAAVPHHRGPQNRFQRHGQKRRVFYKAALAPKKSCASKAGGSIPHAKSESESRPSLLATNGPKAAASA